MAAFQKKGDELVTCPYDPVHRLKRSRMQMHIAKCKKNHPDIILEECPFNNLHRIGKHEYTHHLQNCADRMPVDRQLAVNIDRNNMFKGHTLVPSYTNVEDVPQGECWDHEISSGPVPGYTPPSEPPRGGVIMDMGLTRPSERKKVYQSLFRADEEKNIPKVIQNPIYKPAVVNQEADLRKPKQKLEDVLKKDKMLQASMLRERNAQNLGLGRGRAKTDSRIAANIFPSSAAAQPMDRIANGMYALSMGRGNPGVADLANYDADFPILGMGRGSPINRATGKM